VSIPQLTAGGLLVQQGGRLNGGLVADNLLVSGTATANELVVQNGTRVTGGMEIDTLLAQNFTAGTVTVEGGLIDTQSMQVYGDLTAGNYLQFSSREIKENIVDLSNEEALGVLQHLTPVKYNLKANQTKKVHIGFIAENVHPSVASSDRKSVSVMDIVAVLTQVVKEQQKTVKEQQKTIDALVAKSH
jgi:hypothetical protein